MPAQDPGRVGQPAEWRLQRVLHPVAADMQQRVLGAKLFSFQAGEKEWPGAGLKLARDFRPRTTMQHMPVQVELVGAALPPEAALQAGPDLGPFQIIKLRPP